MIIFWFKVIFTFFFQCSILSLVKKLYSSTKDSRDVLSASKKKSPNCSWISCGSILRRCRNEIMYTELFELMIYYYFSQGADFHARASYEPGTVVVWVSYPWETKKSIIVYGFDRTIVLPSIRQLTTLPMRFVVMRLDWHLKLKFPSPWRILEAVKKLLWIERHMQTKIVVIGFEQYAFIWRIVCMY